LGFVLIVHPSEGESREFRLVEGETHAGRDPANALVLEGRGVSRRHAKFVLQGARLTLVDLGSTYGTRVNDVTTLRRELSDGDEVLLGMNKLAVKTVDDPPPVLLPPLSATIPSPVPYFTEEVTQAPGGGGGGAGGGGADVHQRKTLEMNRQAIQFVLDNPNEAGQAVQVLPRHDSDLMKAVRRMAAVTPATIPVARQTVPPRGAEYQALLLMYKVTELLAAASDREEFLGQVSDLVLEEVRADTVVVLGLDGKGELVPEVIRHRGTLTAGEVPISRGIVDRVLAEKAAVMSNDVGHDERIKSGQSVMLYKIRAVVALPMMGRGELQGVLYLSRSGLQNFSPADADLMGALASLVASGLERAELKERVAREKQHRKALERFHPPEVVEQLASSMPTGEESLGEHQATVLVCDLHDFSDLVRRVPPRQLASVLHEYYEMLYDKIFSNGGSLVKLHDGWSLALFGAPHSPDRDAVWAVEAARELCAEFTEMALLWPAQSLALRCALDSGTVVSGVVGSTERLEHVALGVPITTASMMARAAERTSICVSERTFAELPRTRYKVQQGAPLGELRTYLLHS
jgi:class 3 adenylate cyclase